MSVSSEAVESLAETTEDLEIEVEAGDSSEDEPENEPSKGLETIAEGSENMTENNTEAGGDGQPEDGGGDDSEADTGDADGSDGNNSEDGDEEDAKMRTKSELADIKEEPLVEFPDTDLKIQYDR